MILRWLAAAFLLLWSVPSIQAVEVAIEYPALQRILAKQMFTQDGRRYVRGSLAEKCNYAYLENPRIEARENRLRVQAHFSGRSASNLFGYCFGLGDDFDLAITAVPYYHDGLIGFREVRVESLGRDGFYIRRVCAAMQRSLSTDFQYHLFDDAKRMLEEKHPADPYDQKVAAFRVPQVAVTPTALVLTLDFTLTVH